MSAINLPVESYQGHDGSWIVNDQTTRLCQSLTKDQAEQIAISLNLHDELVSELTRLRDVVGETDFELIGKLLERANP